MASRACCQPSDHDVYHGDAYPGFTTLRPFFKIPRQTTELHQPGESAFHHPAARQHHKAFLPIELGHDRKRPTRKALEPVAKTAFAIPAVGSEKRQTREAAQQLHQHEFGPVVVLNPGTMHHHDQQEAHRVYRDMALAPFDLLTSIKAVVPPFCGARTDCESIIAAEGVASLPACTRTFSRRAS